ncbi:MAG: hypothetical protein ACTSUL_07795 [Promethearchaeota archaeon]
MPFYVAFDVSHKPRGRIDENLTELRDFLNNNDFICYNFLETPITQATLKYYDILVFPCPDFVKLSALEISEIVNWVKEDGGGLLLLSHAGGDRGRNSNLSELSQYFGIIFENDQVLDETNNLGMENIPIITSFIPPHPITNGVKVICYRSGCSLSIVGNAISIASSNETSEPFSTPLICVSEAENGRVCAIGSYEMFRDKVGGGFNCEDHPKFVFNLFNWLISDYRIELKKKGAIPEIEPPASERLMPHVESPKNVSESLEETSSKKRIDLELHIKISSKSELMELLKIFQNQIDIMKTTIDKLIRMVEASEDEIIELKNLPETTTGKVEEHQVNIEDYKSIQEDIMNTTKPSIGEKPIFTDLPPKPKTLLKKGKPPTLQSEDSKQLETKESVREKKIDKEELKAEKRDLEHKVISIKDLLNFVEKKYKSKDIDEKSYTKRVNQLKSDLTRIQKRLNEINDLLK